MKKYFYYLFVLAVMISCDSSSQEYDLAIKNVTLFDSKTKELHKNKTILIKADKIAAIIDSDKSFKASKTIEGKEKLVTPGFIDTHTHLGVNYGVNIDYATKDLKPENLEMIRRLTSHQYLNEGVTTIIDMGQPENWMDVTMNWQKNPTPEHPNVFNCGGSIVSDEDRWQPAHHIEVKNPEDGRKKVREYAAKGLKHMKLYRKLKKPDMIAMVDEAKKYGITINTHVDNNVVTIPEAMDFGISNFEHFFTLIPSVLSYDKHWPIMNKEYGIRMNSNIDEFTAHMVFFFSYIKDNPEFDTKLKSLFDRMAMEGATLSTAVNVLASVPEKTDFFSSFEYFPIRNAPIVSYNKDQDKQLQTAFKDMMQYLKLAHDKGVKIRIGTDCRFGGRSLLSELKLFYEAGISIVDILQIATLNGYEAMQLDDQFGSIEVGKKADILIFEKSPVDNYENFLAKKTIIKDGKVFSLKKSIAYELEKVMVFEGVEAGKKLFKEALKDASDCL
jgi:imidazolonepropionase-like amidohydrolase